MKQFAFPSYLAQPLIISLLPLLLLAWNLDDDWNRALQAQQEAFRELTDRLSVRVRRVTAPEFWPEEWTRRLCRSLGRTRDGKLTPAAVDQALRQWRPEIASESQVWVAACDSTGDQVSLPAEGGTAFKRVWTDIFRFFFFCYHHPDDLALGKDGLKKIRGLFGEHLPVSLLSPDQRGRAFPVLFRGESYWLCWELIFTERNDAQGHAHRELIGGVLALYPQRRLQHRRIMQLVLRRWRTLVLDTRGVECAFLPLPIKPGTVDDPPIGSRRWLKGKTRQRLVAFLKQHKLRGSEDGCMGGDPVLPGSAVNEILDLETHWGRVLPAAPILGHAVMLCGAKRVLQPPLRAVLVRWFAGVLILGWTLVFLFRGLYGRFPDPGIRLGMQLWFLGLLAVPLILMLYTATGWLADFRANLLTAKRQEMEQVVAQIEAGTRVLNEEHLQLLQQLSSSPDLGRRLHQVETGQVASSVFMNQFLESILSQGMDPGAIFFFGHGGFEFSIMRKAHLAEQEEEMRQLVRSLAEGMLQKAEPELAEKYKLQEQARAANAPKRVNPFKGLAANPMALMQAGSLEEFRVGRVSMMKFHTTIRREGRVHYCMFTFWSFDRTCRVFLKSQIPRMNLAYRDLLVAAFRENQDGLETLYEPRGSSQLKQCAELAREQPVFRERDGNLFLGVQSRSLPGYLLAVQGSLDSVQQSVRDERNRLLAAVLLLALMVAISAVGLSSWLADPIFRMTNAILKIAAGNLDIRIAEPRPDELGEAGESIDEMTRQLQERRRMSRFVAPQVLEMTASGALNSTMQANEQNAVVLVSDIRDFTTISETQPPEAVFALLNEHFKVMARVIRSHGGVIDRFLGDAVQAIFYRTEGQESPAFRAMLAASDMMRGHHLLSVHRQRRQQFPYQIGVGIDAGEVVSGVVGDPARRLDFMVLGDVIRQAAELEALTKRGAKTRIVCSGRVRRDSKRDDLFELLDADLDAWELGRLLHQEQI